jgi:hypothetical protein
VARASDAHRTPGRRGIAQQRAQLSDQRRVAVGSQHGVTRERHRIEPARVVEDDVRRSGCTAALACVGSVSAAAAVSVNWRRENIGIAAW